MSSPLQDGRANYPGNVLRKRPTNNRSRDGANSPHTADDAKPLASQSKRDQIRHDNLGQSYQATAANALQGTADEEGGKLLGHGADNGTDEEKHQAGQDHWFAAKDVREGSKIGLKDGGAE